MLIEEQIKKYELPTIEEGFDYLIKKLWNLNILKIDFSKLELNARNLSI
jgi:hypothetical protein